MTATINILAGFIQENLPSNTSDSAQRKKTEDKNNNQSTHSYACDDKGRIYSTANLRVCRNIVALDNFGRTVATIDPNWRRYIPKPKSSVTKWINRTQTSQTFGYNTRGNLTAKIGTPSRTSVHGREKLYNTPLEALANNRQIQNGLGEYGAFLKEHLKADSTSNRLITTHHKDYFTDLLRKAKNKFDNGDKAGAQVYLNELKSALAKLKDIETCERDTKEMNEEAANHWRQYGFPVAPSFVNEPMLNAYRHLRKSSPKEWDISSIKSSTTKARDNSTVFYHYARLKAEMFSYDGVLKQKRIGWEEAYKTVLSRYQGAERKKIEAALEFIKKYAPNEVYSANNPSGIKDIDALRNTFLSHDKEFEVHRPLIKQFIESVVKEVPNTKAYAEYRKSVDSNLRKSERTSAKLAKSGLQSRDQRKALAEAQKAATPEDRETKLFNAETLAIIDENLGNLNKLEGALKGLNTVASKWYNRLARKMGRDEERGQASDAIAKGKTALIKARELINRGIRTEKDIEKLKELMTEVDYGIRGANCSIKEYAKEIQNNAKELVGFVSKILTILSFVPGGFAAAKVTNLLAKYGIKRMLVKIAASSTTMAVVSYNTNIVSHRLVLDQPLPTPKQYFKEMGKQVLFFNATGVALGGLGRVLGVTRGVGTKLPFGEKLIKTYRMPQAVVTGYRSLTRLLDVAIRNGRSTVAIEARIAAMETKMSQIALGREVGMLGAEAAWFIFYKQCESKLGKDGVTLENVFGIFKDTFKDTFSTKVFDEIHTILGFRIAGAIQHKLTNGQMLKMQQKALDSVYAKIKETKSQLAEENLTPQGRVEILARQRKLISIYKDLKGPERLSGDPRERELTGLIASNRRENRQLRSIIATPRSLADALSSAYSSVGNVSRSELENALSKLSVKERAELAEAIGKDGKSTFLPDRHSSKINRLLKKVGYGLQDGKLFNRSTHKETLVPQPASFPGTKRGIVPNPTHPEAPGQGKVPEHADPNKTANITSGKSLNKPARMPEKEQLPPLISNYLVDLHNKGTELVFNTGPDSSTWTRVAIARGQFERQVRPGTELSKQDLFNADNLPKNDKTYIIAKDEAHAAEIRQALDAKQAELAKLNPKEAGKIRDKYIVLTKQQREAMNEVTNAMHDAMHDAKGDRTKAPDCTPDQTSLVVTHAKKVEEYVAAKKSGKDAQRPNIETDYPKHQGLVNQIKDHPIVKRLKQLMDKTEAEASRQKSETKPEHTSPRAAEPSKPAVEVAEAKPATKDASVTERPRTNEWNDNANERKAQKSPKIFRDYIVELHRAGAQLVYHTGRSLKLFTRALISEGLHHTHADVIDRTYQRSEINLFKKHGLNVDDFLLNSKNKPAAKRTYIIVKTEAEARQVRQELARRKSQLAQEIGRDAAQKARDRYIVMTEAQRDAMNKVTDAMHDAMYSKPDKLRNENGRPCTIAQRNLLVIYADKVELYLASVMSGKSARRPNFERDFSREKDVVGGLKDHPIVKRLNQLMDEVEASRQKSASPEKAPDTPVQPQRAGSFTDRPPAAPENPSGGSLVGGVRQAVAALRSNPQAGAGILAGIFALFTGVPVVMGTTIPADGSRRAMPRPSPTLEPVPGRGKVPAALPPLPEPNPVIYQAVSMPAKQHGGQIFNVKYAGQDTPVVYLTARDGSIGYLVQGYYTPAEKAAVKKAILSREGWKKRGDKFLDAFGREYTINVVFNEPNVQIERPVLHGEIGTVSFENGTGSINVSANYAASSNTYRTDVTVVGNFRNTEAVRRAVEQKLAEGYGKVSVTVVPEPVRTPATSAKPDIWTHPQQPPKPQAPKFKFTKGETTKIGDLDVYWTDSTPPGWIVKNNGATEHPFRRPDGKMYNLKPGDWQRVSEGTTILEPLDNAIPFNHARPHINWITIKETPSSETPTVPPPSATTAPTAGKNASMHGYVVRDGKLIPANSAKGEIGK